MSPAEAGFDLLLRLTERLRAGLMNFAPAALDPLDVVVLLRQGECAQDPPYGWLHHRFGIT
jgi:hypothetical protein